jgi:hypothetical protein
MKVKILILSIILFISSCSSLNIWGYKNLGDHYFLWEADHYKYDLIWTDNDRHAEAGGALIIENIVKYDYNKAYIIAKTTEYKSANDSINKFWLIDKRKVRDVTLIQPLDSIGLIKFMQKNEIKLILKDVSLQ